MTLFTLAVRNIRHELRRYSAFFLSAAFSVWMFYLYTSLLNHPQMSPEEVPNELLGPLQAVTWVVAVFAVLFILYAQTSFLKLRQKELGIYSLLGMTPGEMGRVVTCENLAVGLGATLAGVGLGTVCLPLFYLGVGRLLRLASPPGFYLSGKALLLTAGLFLAVFGVVSLAAYLRLRRLPVAELIRAAAKPKVLPKLAWWKIALCAGAVVAAYWLLFTIDTKNAEGRVLVIIALLLVGTALLFSQGSAAALTAVKRRRALYWRPANLISVSQLVYKMQDNARVLFMVSILATLMLVAGGIYYGAHLTAADWAETVSPVHVIMNDEHGTVDAARVVQVLKAHGTPPVAEGHLPLITDLSFFHGPGDSAQFFGVTVAPVGAVNAWTSALLGAVPLTVDAGQGLVFTTADQFWGETVKVGYAPFRLDPRAASVTPVIGPELRPVKGPPGVNANQIVARSRYANLLVVVPESDFARLWELFGKEHGLTLHGYNVADWRKSGPAIRQLSDEIIASVPYWRNMLESPWVRPLTGTWSWYDSQRQETAIFLFVFGFLCLLFFLAAGSMIYFKLFTDLQDDRREFQNLHKLGIGAEQVRRIISVQTLVIFFAPFAVAAVHASVILQAMGGLLAFPTSLWGAIRVVVAAYLVLQGAYFLVARRTYTAAVLSEM